MIEIETLWKYDLRRGNTDHPGNGACLYDAAKWISYGEIGDDPPCACPVIRAYAIGLNDMLPDDQRQRLKPFILRVGNNRDPESEPARAEYLIRCAVGMILPIALEGGRLMERAAVLRRVARDGSLEDVRIVAEDAAGATARLAADDGRAATAKAAAYAAQAAIAGPHSGTGAAVAKVAEAAADAGNAEVRQWVYDAAMETLDGVLGIGTQADPFDDADVRQAITAFELAREDLPALSLADAA
jgi:hypothetical protein